MATLDILQQRLEWLYKAYEKALAAQQYTGMRGNISVTRESPEKIYEQILKVETQIEIAKNRGQLPYSQAVFSGER